MNDPVAWVLDRVEDSHTVVHDELTLLVTGDEPESHAGGIGSARDELELAGSQSVDPVTMGTNAPGNVLVITPI